MADEKLQANVPAQKQLTAAIAKVCDAVDGLPKEDQSRVLRAAATTLGIDQAARQQPQQRTAPQQNQQRGGNGGR